MKHILIGIVFFLNNTYILSQIDKTDSIYFNVSLDPVIVSSSKLDVNAFIKMCIKDETFYKAFRNLRKINYKSQNYFVGYDKKKIPKTNYQSTTLQHFENKCRTMDTYDESVTGNFFDKKKKINYYTGELFDKLFFTHGKVCNTDDADILDINKKGKTKTEGRVMELKKLIFKPGTKVDVPYLGNRMEIFSPKMIQYYDYSIESKIFNNKIDCYVFKIRVKESAEKKDEDDTVVKFLETYFDKSNLQIVGRTYRLKCDNWMYDFDVLMNIELTKINDKYYPTYIKYDGKWDVVFKSQEQCSFYAKMTDFFEKK
jgi:hypothetical protein